MPQYTTPFDYSGLPRLSLGGPVSPEQQQNAPGMITSAKHALGENVAGLGRLAGDFLPGVSADNAVARYGREVAARNPAGDIGNFTDSPWLTSKQVVGQALAPTAAGIGLTVAGGIISKFGLPGKIIGRGLQAAGIPSMLIGQPYEGIRSAQIEADPTNENSAASKALALSGAGAVAMIERAFGPQQWAEQVMTKEGRKAVAKAFTAENYKQAIAKGALKGSLVESGEELVQNPIEQLASFQNPTTPENIKQTLKGAAAGALAGGLLGGGFGGVGHALREKPAADVTNDDLNAVIDDALAPQAQPAQSMNEEFKLTPSPDRDELVLEPSPAIDGTVVDPRQMSFDFGPDAIQGDPRQGELNFDRAPRTNAPIVDDQAVAEANARLQRTELDKIIADAANQDTIEQSTERMAQTTEANNQRIAQAAAQGDAERAAAGPQIQLSNQAEIDRQNIQRKQMQDTAAGILGRATQFTKKLTATSEPELVAEAMTLAEGGKQAERASLLLEKMGLLDTKTGQFTDFKAAIQQAQVAVNKAKIDVEQNVVAGAPKLAQAEAALDRVTKLAALSEAGQSLYAQRKAEASKVLEPSRPEFELIPAQYNQPRIPAVPGAPDVPLDATGQPVQPRLGLRGGRFGEIEDPSGLKAWPAVSTTFSTSKGSSYEVHADGTTTRTKAARTDIGHEGDFGTKARSEKTYYLTKDAANRLAPPANGKWRIVDHADGTASLATQNTDGNWGIAPSAKNVKVDSTPSAGSVPLEVWGSGKLKGLNAYSKVHFGNDIVDQANNEAEPTTDTTTTKFSGEPIAAASTEVKSTPAELNTKITEVFRSPVNRGRVISIAANTSELPKNLQDAVAQAEQNGLHPKAMVDPVTGKVHVLADRVSADEVTSVVLHEVGVHVGMAKFLGEKLYARLLKQINTWFVSGKGLEGEIAQAAVTRAGINSQAGFQATDEVLAYFVEEAVNRGVDPTAIKTSTPLAKWMRQLWSTLKSALLKLGIKPETLTAQDVVDLAYGSAHMELNRRDMLPPVANTDRVQFSGVAADNQKVQAYAQVADRVRDWAAKHITWKDKAYSVMLGWQPLNHIATQARNILPQVGDFATVDSKRTAVMSRFAQLFPEVYFRFEHLEKTNPKAAAAVEEIMLLTEFRIDPRKSWDEHTWLHTEPNAALLEQDVAKGNKLYRMLRQVKVDGVPAADVYDNALLLNNGNYYATLAMRLRHMVMSDLTTKTIPEFQTDPMDTFLQDARTHGSIKANAEFWKATLDRMVESAHKYMEQQNLENTNLPPEKLAAAKVHLNPLQRELQLIRNSLATLDESPYFHLGRQGEYFVAFDMRRMKGEDGKQLKVVDQEAVKHVSKVLAESGFDGYHLSQTSDKANVFIRLEDGAKAQELVKLVRSLQTQGWVGAETIRSGMRTDKENNEYLAPEWVNKLVAEIVATDAFGDSTAQVAATVQSMWIDLHPDTALQKVMTHRNSVPGASKGMMRNFAVRNQVHGIGISNLWAARPTLDTFIGMKSAINDAQTDAKGDPQRPVVMQQIFSEISKRVSQRKMREEPNGFDKLRAINHAYFLGMSPSYMLLQMTQLGVLTWPELGKKFGYMDSAKALATATPDAFKVMTAVFNQGKKLGWKHATDAVITGASLEASGISKDRAQFIMRIISSGKIDIGNAARELGRVVDAELDSKLATGLRFAASTGYYSETLTRLITALAAKDLYESKTKARDKSPAKMDNYVLGVLNEAMLDYSTGNVARQMGKHSVGGQLAPVAFSFMQYQAQVLWKMYRELHRAFVDSAATDAEKKEAKDFLKGHLTAVMVLAGTQGLPFAAVAATAIDKIGDALGDDKEPWDVKTYWRNFLGSVVGADAGNMIAGGLPRGLGVDISGRVGEQDLLPFSRFISDKRSWEDASKDWSSQLLGSPASMLTNIVGGGNEIARGNVLEGMVQMLPVALKGPAKAYSMSERGYTDKSGNRIPIDVGAADILAQAVGLNPAKRAENNEKALAYKSRTGTLKREASLIRKNMAIAIEQNDPEARAEWQQEAVKFDQAHPDMAILPSMAGTLQRRAQARAFAAATNTPLGVKPTDIAGRELVNFGN